MKRSIAILVFCILNVNICLCDPNEPLPDANLCDCNCVCEPLVLPNAYMFEDFNETLDLNWHILGEDSLYWSLETFPGSLTITTQEGTFEQLYNDHKNVFLIKFPLAQSLDFQVTTCINHFYPYGLWNQAGLVLWNNEDNFLKYVYEFGEEPPPNNAIKLLFSAAIETNGYPDYGWFRIWQIPQKMWLRINKKGDVYELYSSTDGELFEPLTIVEPASLTTDNTVPCLDVPIKYIGIFANNGGSASAPEVYASFEFFEFTVLSDEEYTNEDVVDPNE